MSLTFMQHPQSLNCLDFISQSHYCTNLLFYCISAWVSSDKNKPKNQNKLHFNLTSSCHFSSVIPKEKLDFGGYFFRQAEHLDTDLITRTQHPPHIWVTGVIRKHISHVLKTLQLTSTVDQCHHSETQACLVTAFVRSSSSPMQSHIQTGPM